MIRSVPFATSAQALRRALLLLVSCFFSLAPLAAQQAGVISGTVRSADGSPIADADVEIVTLHRRERVDASGAFRFEGVPAGRHVVEVTSLRAGSTVVDVDVAVGAVLELELGDELTAHRESIVVSASPNAERQFALGSSASVLDASEIAKRAGSSLGATLDGQAGVHQTFFGAGSSRPIVRGLGGDRVRMLESGVGTGDLSDISPDHAVTTEALTAEQIEVLRGPATLLYGSSAIGGVVNVIDEAIPSHHATEPLSGTVDLRGGSAADERSGTLLLRGGSERWAWSLQGLVRETGEYEIPGFARIEEEHHDEGEGHEDEGEEEENPFGRLPNSDTETSQLGAGASWFFGEHGDAGFVGLSVSAYDSNYGITEGAHEHEGEEGEEHDEEAGAEEGGIRLDLQRVRYDLKAAVRRSFGIFDGLEARLGVTDYEHDEIEGNGEIGSHFENDSWEGRVELTQRRSERWNGAIGILAGSRDFSVVGEEAYLPPSTTDTLDLFVYEELDLGAVSLQFGGRYGSRDIVVDSLDLPDRDFDGLSGSFGLVWDRGASVIGGSVARSSKFPSAEELYSNGAHVATQTFEVGNPALEEETSLGVDLFYRYRSERTKLELSLFRNDFSDFVYPAPTGEEVDALPVVAYRQQDAEFTGAELDARFELVERDGLHVHLGLGGDLVDAELADGSNVPLVPPLRLSGSLGFERGPWSAEAELVWNDDQTDVAENETATAGSTVVNAFVGYRLVTARGVYDLLLRGSNLTDEEVRLHTSYLKNLAPLPGRDLSLALRMAF